VEDTLDVTGAVERALEIVADVDGWMSPDQGRRLFEAASVVPPGGRIVEIGSYHGRSTVLLALAADTSTVVVAIDPHAGHDRGPQQFAGTRAQGERDHRAFRATLERARVTHRITHLRLPSQGAHAAMSGQIDLLYIDGAHRYQPASDDLRRWGRRVEMGGTMFVHDAFSSVGVTAALMRHVTFGRTFAYIGRTRSLAEYRRVDVCGPRERAVNTLRQVLELAWFTRNVAIKLAIVARLRPIARALAGRDPEWPY
jgi:predicted O-methyltransferase YrrM